MAPNGLYVDKFFIIRIAKNHDPSYIPAQSLQCNSIIFHLHVRIFLLSRIFGAALVITPIQTVSKTSAVAYSCCSARYSSQCCFIRLSGFVLPSLQWLAHTSVDSGYFS